MNGADLAKGPSAIIYPTDYLPIGNSDQVEIIEKFLVALESSLGVQRVKVSFKDVWKRSAPKEAQGMDLETYMKDVGLDC